MIRTLEELAATLDADPKFHDLSDEEQQAAFNELARDIEPPGQSRDVPQQDFGQQPQGPIRSALTNVLDRPRGATEAARQANPALWMTGPFAGGIAQAGLAGAPAQQAATRGFNYPSTAPSPNFGQKFPELYYRTHPNDIAIGGLPGAAQAMGALPPALAGMAADAAYGMFTNPAEAIAGLAGALKPVQRGVQAIAQSSPGQAVGKFLTKERNFPQLGRPRPVDYLRGNPQAIQEAETALNQAAHKQVLRFRQRGDLHDQIRTYLGHKAEEAWAPMKQVIASIPEPISASEIKSAAAQQLAQQPERLEAMNLFLDDLLEQGQMPKTGRQVAMIQTAADWSDLSSEVGQQMNKAGFRGKAAKTFSDLVKTDLRSAIADVLEAKAPESLKGMVAEAKFNWGNYAADRDQIFKYLSPGAVPNVPTNQGASFLAKAAKGQLSPSEAEFVNRLQGESGIDVVKNLTEHAKKIYKLERGGRRGQLIRKSIIPSGVGLAAVEYLSTHKGR